MGVYHPKCSVAGVKRTKRVSFWHFAHVNEVHELIKHVIFLSLTESTLFVLFSCAKMVHFCPFWPKASFVEFLRYIYRKIPTFRAPYACIPGLSIIMLRKQLYTGFEVLIIFHKKYNHISVFCCWQCKHKNRKSYLRIV